MLAVSLAGFFGAMQSLHRVSADSGVSTTFVPIEPCRLFDLRPEYAVGPRTTPLRAGETFEQQVTGAVGDCSVPADARGVAMNVTIARPTASSFLAVFPAGETRPNASSLNWVADQAPTPNKVDSKLSRSGAIALYNHVGSVHVVADVVGYYTSSPLEHLQAQITALQADAGLARMVGPTVSDGYEARVPLETTSYVDVLTVPVVYVPADGKVVVSATASVAMRAEHDFLVCYLYEESNGQRGKSLTSSSGGSAGGTSYEFIADQQTFDVEAGSPIDVRFRCRSSAGDAALFDIKLTAIYVPNVEQPR